MILLAYDDEFRILLAFYQMLILQCFKDIFIGRIVPRMALFSPKYMTPAFGQCSAMLANGKRIKWKWRFCNQISQVNDRRFPGFR